MTTDPRNENLPAARSAAYGLIAAGFAYPERETLRLLLEPSRLSGWPAVLAGSADTLAGSLEAVLSTVGELRRHPNPVEPLQADYVALFGHAVRGACPPYELEYGPSEIIQRSSDLADISGFYAAFGLMIDETSGDRPDHVCAEAEFMSVLCAKEAYGCATGDCGMLEQVENAQSAFLQDHLGQWLPAFAGRVADADSEGFYKRLGAFAGRFIVIECERAGVTAGPPYLELRPVDAEAETTIDCGQPVIGGPGTANAFTPLTIGCSDRKDVQ